MKSIFKASVAVGVFSLVVLSSCNLSKKAIESPEVEFTCDENITYTSTIKGIFDARCTGCHSGEKPAYNINLTTFESASKVVDKRLTCVIGWEDNCNKMPPSGGQLSSVERQQIQCWIDNGKKR